MNNSFIKMLRFEFKSNYLMSIFILLVSILLMLFSLSTLSVSDPRPVFDILFPIFAFPTWYFTWNAYQESLKMQTLQMYHLLPVSLNTKFFSKLFITVIVFPVLVLSVFIILKSIHNTVFSDNPWVVEFPTLKHFWMVLTLWILCHSICTIFAIVFKRNKALYSLITISVFILSVIILDKMTEKLFGFSVVDPLLNEKANPVSSVVSYVLPVVLYISSYRLFTRRQL